VRDINYIYELLCFCTVFVNRLKILKKQLNNMLLQKLLIILIYDIFIRHLIRKLLHFPERLLQLSEKDMLIVKLFKREVEKNPDLTKMHRRGKRKEVTPGAGMTAAPHYYSDPLSVILTAPPVFNNTGRLLRDNNNIHRQMHQRLAVATRSFIKRWNDGIIHYLSLLFGLCNTSPGNIYEAIFGASFVRIH